MYRDSHRIYISGCLPSFLYRCSPLYRNSTTIFSPQNNGAHVKVIPRLGRQSKRMCHHAANQSASKVQNRQTKKTTKQKQKQNKNKPSRAHFKTRCLPARVQTLYVKLLVIKISMCTNLNIFVLGTFESETTKHLK